MGEVAENRSNELALRTLSALVLIPVALVPLWFGGWAFAGLLIAAGFFISREWSALVYASQETEAVIQAYGLAFGAVLAIVLATLGSGLAAVAVAGAAGCLLSARQAWLAGPIAPPLWGAAYLILPLIILVGLRQDPSLGLSVIVWLMCVVWGVDTGAYIAGRLIGGPKLVPRLSPGKTWAGLAGGACVAAIVGYIGAWATQSDGSLGLVLLSVVLAFASQTGDILESVLKRRAGVKDSGALIPGHGGLLDRVDGLIFAILVVGAVAWLRVGALSPAGVLAWP